MKTFSIALGRYAIATEAAMSAGSQSLALVGGEPEDINTKEARDAKRALAIERALAEGTTEAASAEATETVTPPPEVHPLHIGPEDTLEFGVDGDDYSTCVLTAHHADGSKDWVKFHRNSLALATGWSPVPPPPEPPPEETVLAGSGQETVPVETETPVEQEAEDEYVAPKRGRNRY